MVQPGGGAQHHELRIMTEKQLEEDAVLEEKFVAAEIRQTVSDELRSLIAQIHASDGSADGITEDIPGMNDRTRAEGWQLEVRNAVREIQPLLHRAVMRSGVPIPPLSVATTTPAAATTPAAYSVTSKKMPTRLKTSAQSLSSLYDTEKPWLIPPTLPNPAWLGRHTPSGLVSSASAARFAAIASGIDLVRESDGVGHRSGAGVLRALLDGSEEVFVPRTKQKSLRSFLNVEPKRLQANRAVTPPARLHGKQLQRPTPPHIRPKSALPFPGPEPEHVHQRPWTSDPRH